MQKLLLLLLILPQLLLAQVDNYEEKMKRTEWFREARFGMFIHFGLYAIPARGEWVRHDEKISNEDYQIYFDEFNPTDFNPKEWAKIAKNAGMKYVVMTAKHHEGFALFDSKLTDYKSTNTPCKRDLVREYLEAFRAEGIKVGLYFSLIDWYHPDYPKFADNFHPMRGNPKYKDEKINWDNYIKFMHGQMRELMTNYGKIDILWSDFSYGEMSGEKWKATELIKMVKTLQPHIIMNKRMGGDGTADAKNKTNEFGDIETPEQGVPEAMLKDASGRPVPWETCLTLNNGWGYHRLDENWKSADLLINTLVNCVSKSGNLLLNVGPDAKGNIPDESIRILGEIGKWMKKNGSSIYGCGTSSTIPLKPEWGRVTQKGKYVYLHLTESIIGHINLPGFDSKVKKVRLLRDGSEIKPTTAWWGDGGVKGNYFLNLNSPSYQNFTNKEQIDTVYELELK